MAAMSDLSRRIANLPPEKRAMLEARLLREKAAGAPAPSIPRRGERGPSPLSFAQQRLWFLDQLDPGKPYYNLPLALRFTGELDVPALSRALDAIVARHEVLRTTFSTRDGEPLQVIGPPRRVALERRSLSGASEGDRTEALRRTLADELGRPFDLTRDSMLRATLVQEGDRSHVLLLMMHHIASDGWSIGALLGELAAFYEANRSGSEPSVPDLPIQYADYAVWQREWLRGGVEQSQLAYWKECLGGELPLLALPSDRPRPAQQTFAGAQERRLYARGLAEKLESLSRQEGATLFMTLLAAFQVFLSRLSGQEDILVGTPIAGRKRAETENLIGFFVNTLVIRADLTGDPTFRELLGRVRERALEAYAHQDLPFEKLVEALHPDRDLAHSPLFQVMFTFENDPISCPEMPGLSLQNVEFDTLVSNFDLTLDMALQEQRLFASIEFNTDLFGRQGVRRWLENLEVLLAGIVADPGRRLSELPLLTAVERDRLLSTWNATSAEFPAERCVHDLFEAQAASNPEAVAAELDGQSLTYGELDRRANRLAHRLRELGVGPEAPVGICLERSLETAVALLGVLKAGGAYVPLDPTYPPARLRFFLEDAGASVLLTQTRFGKVVGEGQWKTLLLDAEGERADRVDAEPPESGVEPENLAYIIYTSGSTGRPKGVEISHRSLVNHVTAVARHYSLAPSDRVLQFASLSFDVAAEEIFPTWAAGAAVVFRSGEAMGAPELQSLIESRRLTVLNLPAGFWHEWVSELSRTGQKPPPPLRLVVAGSERVLTEKLDWWRRHVNAAMRWMNGYGPTEATITATLYEPGDGELPATASAPIGRPIANARLYVADRHGGLAPIGAAGELWIGGEGVARGYRGDPELTARFFATDPFGPPGGRVYRTGDRVRYLPDGNLEFLGRLDEQVKVRGFRIELPEVEAALERHAAVREAAVAAREGGPEGSLAAYVVFQNGAAPTAAELRAHVKELLPGYMVPSAFVVMDALPRTESGKVDRRRLPDPGRSRDGEDGFVAPRTPLEEAVARIWADLLHVERVGALDNFFVLGGHSLLATQVISRLRETFSLELPLRVLFEAPTVAELSIAIAQSQAEQAAPEALAHLLEELEREAPASPPPGSRPV
jgi:amino acid adenylation domain-containing protein